MFTSSSGGHRYKLAPKMSALLGPIDAFGESSPVLSDGIRFCSSDTEPTAFSRDAHLSVVVVMILLLFAFLANKLETVSSSSRISVLALRL